MKDSIGSFWLKTAKSGERFMSGELTLPDGSKVSVVMFKNDKGDNEKRPDYRLFLSEERPAQASATSAYSRPQAPPPRGYAPGPVSANSDIPF